MKFYETLNLIVGGSLILGIEFEVLHKTPHIEISDYFNVEENIMFVVSGFVETTIVRGVVLPNLLNPNFTNSFTMLNPINSKN